MLALFIGLGSIGQRHLRNIRKYFPQIKIIAYRNSRQTPVLDENNNPLKNVEMAQYYQLKEYENLEEALNKHPEMVFVTNPSRFHYSATMAALKKGAHVFIEKPLSHDLDSAKSILELEKNFDKKLCMVGFQYRYSPTLIKLKEIINCNLIGNLINGQIANGEYLPYWHPYEDYRKSYAAREDLGGGAILTQIHDFDYAIYLFGMPKSLFATGGKLSNLEINVEDSVNISTCFKYKNKILPININLDYISWPSRRYIKLYGDKGSLNCDLNKNTIEVHVRESKNTLNFNFASTSRNDLFIDELQNFISFVEGKEEPKVDLEEGMKSLKFALAAKSSLINKTPIEL
tara:strand:- start:718 stop:1752 length:1035 start_codon:yes stop_codon:yes gene_type:complete